MWQADEAEASLVEEHIMAVVDMFDIDFSSVFWKGFCFVSTQGENDDILVRNL